MFAALALAIALQHAPAPAPFNARARIQEAITLVRPAAYRSAEVDWAALETDLLARSSDARDTVDLLPVYSHLLEALGDHHSFVQVDPALREAYKARHGREFDADVVRPVQTSAFIMRRDRTARTLALGVAEAELVTAPKVFGGGQDARDYADAVFGHVAAASDRACAYVVDLRGNVGGNVWPMKAGLSALLGEAWLNADDYARFENGAFLINEGEHRDRVAARVSDWRPLPRLADIPVAVLIDDGVASSGEGIALAFSGRVNTRFFGQGTAGVASSNEGFLLSDGVNLVVTTDMMRDRDSRTWPDGRPPDVQVMAGEGSAGDPDDAVVEAAKTWLAGLTACGA